MTLEQLESLAARKYPIPRCIYERQKTLEKRKLFVERKLQELKDIKEAKGESLTRAELEGRLGGRGQKNHHFKTA